MVRGNYAAALHTNARNACESSDTGDVTRFEMSSAASRLVGYSASTYLVRGVLVDCGFHADARHDRDASSTASVRAACSSRTTTRTMPATSSAWRSAASPIAASAETIARMRAPAPDPALPPRHVGVGAAAALARSSVIRDRRV